LVNPRKTTLTAFFELCSHDDFAKTLFYHEVLSYYTWDDGRGWLKRRRGKNVPGWPRIKIDTAIGRIYTIHPNQSECFHLRLLLNYVQGPTSFESLKEIDGVIHATFKAPCFALGLLENDDQWKTWCCINNKCQSKIYTNNTEDEIIEKNVVRIHNHDKDTTLNRQEVNNLLKRKVSEDNIVEKPSKFIITDINNFNNENNLNTNDLNYPFQTPGTLQCAYN